MSSRLPLSCTPLQTPPRRAKRHLAVAGLCALLTVFAVQPASAATCSTLGSCRVGSKAASFAANTAVGTALSVFVSAVQLGVNQLLDELTRLANSDSQDSTSKNTADLNSIDSENAARTAADLGARRADLALGYIPSKSTCSLVTRSVRRASNQFSAARVTLNETSQRVATDYAANAPGGPTEKGSLQAFNTLFNDTNNGFCDPAVLYPGGVPAGMTCTQVNDAAGRPMAWRYTQPFEAVLSKDTIPSATTDPEYRAARLFARIAVEPVPPDPMRGPMLSRNEGRNAFIMRQHDIAAMNLARGVIDRMIDDRLWDGNPSNPSLQQQRIQAWEDAATAYQDAIQRAGQGEETNLRDLPVIAKDINHLYFEIFTSLERLLALKATRLARVIESTSGAGGQSSTGPALIRQ